MATTFGVVGSGWRARFFVRLAEAVPQRLRAVGLVARSPERAAGAGVRVFASVPDLLAHERPDFVLVAVSAAAAPDVIRQLVALGVPVLAETPPAADLAGMRALWSDVGARGLVQVAEQYPLTPAHAARAAVLRSGALGAPTAVQLCSTQLHHAAALIRDLLGVGFAPAEVSARRFVAPLCDPLTRAGWASGTDAREATTTVATLDFGGAVGLYDYTDNQWRNPLRSRRTVVRAVRGEIVDDEVVRLAGPGTVVRSALVPQRTGLETVLTGLDLRHIGYEGGVVYRNPFAGTGLAEDDVAVADLVERTGAWARDAGPPPYPLAQACQDHLIGLAIEESARTGRPVTTSREAWGG